MNSEEADSELSNLRRELDSTLDSASRKAREIVSKGHEIATEGQSVIDWADATKQASKSMKSTASLENLVQSWKRVDSTALYLNTYLTAASYQILSSTTYAANVGSMMILGQQQPDSDADLEAVRRINDLAARPEVYKSVAALLKNLQLDKAGGNLLSAYEQLETAHGEYLVNVASANQATTWLIPMRECILTVLDCLLKRTHIQKKVKGISAKVIHVLERLSRSGTPPGHIENLASECERLLSENLSPSKQQPISRSESESTLLTATMWLKGFLALLDPAKLQKPAR